MVKLVFVDAARKLIILQYTDPPALPNVGDITQTPDGRAFIITQRTYLLIPQPKLQLSKTKMPTACIEIRCLLEEVVEARKVE